MNKLSAVIITQNEERNIGRCIDSLSGIADEIIVVDSGSSDQTEQICVQKGVCFQYHPWQGFAEQKNYAATLATGHWILSIDADEALSPQLRDAIAQVKEGHYPDDVCFSFNRLSNYCGHWIRHCGWYPDTKIRIWKNGTAHWDGLVHEEIRTQASSTIHLSGDLLHYTYYSIADHAARQVKYATLAAQKAHQQGKKCSPCDLWVKPLWNFLRNYIFKGGFIDGQAGFIVCRMSAFYTFVKYANLKELNKQ